MTTSFKELKDLLTYYYGLSGDLKQLYGDVDLNFHLRTVHGEQYVVKLKKDLSQKESLLFQHQMAGHLVTSGLVMPSAIKSLHQETVLSVRYDQEDYLLSLLTWIDGPLWSSQLPQSDAMLASLGSFLGRMTSALQSFEHPAAHRSITWDNASADWVGGQLHIFPTEKKELIEDLYNQYEFKADARNQLRKSIIHNDANDNNIILGRCGDTVEVKSIIDYGDALHSYTINELANALAYIMMDKHDPASVAMKVIRAYHKEFSLNQGEIELLPLMIATRLMLSVTHSTINHQNDPENEYHQISAEGAWKLLAWFHSADVALMIARFRYACDWAPVGSLVSYAEAEEQDKLKAHPIVDGLHIGNVSFLDLSVDSPLLGHYTNYQNLESFQSMIDRQVQASQSRWGVGRYGEIRPIYTTDGFTELGDEGSQWRTAHLGLDLFGSAGSPVYAPMDGVVHRCKDNGMELDYGPTVILRHEIDNLTFFTLYGHLSQTDLSQLDPGQSIRAGEVFAHFGTASENGGWPPHLHFQIILDLFEHEHNYPGVVLPQELDFWKHVCPDPSTFLQLNLASDIPHANSEQGLLETRKKVLGRSLSISYQRPLHMVRGLGPYLMDKTGRRYLDMVNNVAHVGHEHPKVVEAGRRQMGLLNTNTRYLHEELIAFAEELTATLPPSLSVCHFVNSGSEANELALRMAKVYTGAGDIIAVAHGYHGNTQECINVSSYKFDSPGGAGKPDYVQLLDMPDIYRGAYRDIEAGAEYAAQAATLIVHLERKERKPAALICESILSCGGQIPLPPNYLKLVYEQVRKAGGVCIVDEVQVGIGRVGAHYWGFELSGVVPDIVTIGKPLGNGHPVAAVVTTPEIADAFNNGMEFFNTFGGNPVSCAIGRSVLSVVKEEGLQQHALEIGDHLQKGLLQLQSRYPIIGNVRGVGLFQGFELVADQGTLTPAAKQADYLANRMRDKGVLLSTDGPLHNVIKIKPPMVIQRSDIDMALDLMDQVFGETAMKIG
ncbi:MAG: aminotransferase class III-fold pyridoxal phosphate-dependent enzyme [Cyclobacteriaceae bacterium]